LQESGSPLGWTFKADNPTKTENRSMSNTQKEITEMEINGVKFIRADKISQIPEIEGDYVIVRCKNAGVHAGYLINRADSVVKLQNSRRLWRWWSKFTLSGLAMCGVLSGKESECRFSCVTPRIDLTESDVAEIIYTTEEAKQSILSIKEYTNE